MVCLLGGRTYSVPTSHGVRSAVFWGYHTEVSSRCAICGKTTKVNLSFTDAETEEEITIGVSCVSKVCKEVA